MAKNASGGFIPVRDYEQDAADEVDASPAHFMEQVQGIYDALNEAVGSINIARDNLRSEILGGVPPAALDSIRELAVQLQQMAQEDLDLLALLATKAPVDSPVLTGQPSAPTPSQDSNGTTLSTTGFVHAAVNALTAAVDIAAVNADIAAVNSRIDGILGGVPLEEFDTIAEIAEELAKDNIPLLEWGSASMNWGTDETQWGASI